MLNSVSAKHLSQGETGKWLIADLLPAKLLFVIFHRYLNQDIGHAIIFYTQAMFAEAW